jgi:hypothetical protein
MSKESFLFADHEAGHAVVAAYLRVPFRYATNSRVTMAYEPRVRRFSFDRKTYSMHERPKAEIDRELHRQIRNQAIVTLGARAAVDAMSAKYFPTDYVEQTYADDEKCLERCAEMMGVADFRSWREGLLKVAREIVSIPHVTSAILLVSVELRLVGRMSAKQVRDELRRWQPMNRRAV